MTASDGDWRRAYFYRGRRHGLAEAPRPDRPSHALTELREAHQRNDEHQQHLAAEAAESHRRHRGALAQAQRERDARARWRSMTPDLRAGVRADVMAFGLAAVLAVWRRTDPTFDLPECLEDER